MPLLNPGFEDGWEDPNYHKCYVFPTDGQPMYETDIGNIFTPDGWVTWFRHDPGNLDQPEVRNVWASMYPERVHSGISSMLLFTFFRRHDGGFLQQVNVRKGQRLRLSAYAHAWSNHPTPGHDDCTDNGLCSTGVGREPFFALTGDVPPPNSGDPWTDAIANFTFQVGIDPTGGVDPMGEHVIWGRGAHIYNAFHEVPQVEATAQSDTVTVFLRSQTLWAFKHNDAYWDSVSLEVVDDPPPPPTNGGNKVGAHVLRAAEGLSNLHAAPVAVMKYVGEWGSAINAHPSTLCVGRVAHSSFDAQSEYKDGKTPLEAAKRIVDEDKRIYQSNPHIKYWEGYNEPVWSSLEEMAWYTQLEIERMKLLDALGFKAVIGNFATGTPPLGLWPAFLDAVRAGFEYEAILGLHEYSWPWMWWMVGDNQVDPSNPLPDDEGWTTLRYRQVYRQFFKPAGLERFPLVITECGIDPLVNPHPPNYCDGGAWRSMCEAWRDCDGEYQCAEYYWQQLEWYLNELERDEFVVGMTLFTLGNNGGAWADYDIAGTPIVSKMVENAGDNPATAFVYPGNEPEPPEPECKGLPRIDYARRYNLVRQDTSLEDAIDILRRAYAARETVGFSADDAGIGDLTDKTVVAWDVDDNDGLEAFYTEHYPGTAIEFKQLSNPPEPPPPPAGIVKLSQRDPQWASNQLGRSVYTIGNAGCAMVSACMEATLVEPGLRPDELNQWLTNNGGYTDGGRLWWAKVAERVDGLEFVSYHKWHNTPADMDMVRAELAQGPAIVQVDFRPGGALDTHFVLGLAIVGEDMAIIDPWDGQEKMLLEGYGLEGWTLERAIYALARYEVDNVQPPSTTPLRGVHDEEGGDWLASERLEGWCTIPVYLGTSPRTLPAVERLAAAGVKPILNLRYSYAVDDGGQGTMPPADRLEAFEAAAIQTIANNPMAWGFVYCNEMNNPREWPADTVLTTSYFTGSYNRVWTTAQGSARIAPGAIDPFNPGWGDWRDSWRAVLEQIDGADFMALHAYDHGVDANPDQMFGNDPLTGVYYNLRVLESQTAIIPDWFAPLHRIVTETNHGADGSKWSDASAAWVRKAYEYFARQRVDGVCLFRYNYGDDRWRFGDHQPILTALRSL